MTNLRLTAETKEQRLGAGNGFMICPRCGDMMHPPFTALSRVHPKTRICPDCGGAEGLLQTAGKAAGWKPVTLEWADTLRDHAREVRQLNDDIDRLCNEVDELQRLADQARSTANQLRQENRKFSERHLKNGEVIYQLTDKIKFMDQQIKDLLDNMLHTREDT